MSESVKIATLTDLTNLVISGETIRFVAENRAWYYSNPNDTSASDGDNIISPNVGTGRWLKTSANTTGLIAANNIIHDLSNIVLSPGTHYLLDMSSATQNCELTLPTTGSIGQFIKISCIQPSTTFRIILKRDTGVTINSDSSDYAFLREVGSATVENTGNNNWITDSRILFKYTLGPYFPQPATTSEPQNGIIHYLGTNYNTTTFGSPSNRARPGVSQKVNLVSNSIIFQTSTLDPFNKTIVSGNAHKVYTNSGDLRTIAVGFYDMGTSTPIPIRVDSVYIEFSPDDIGNTAYDPANIEVLAADAPHLTSWAAFMSELSNNSTGYTDTFSLSGRLSDPLKRGPTIKYINNIPTTAITKTEGHYYTTTSNNAYFLPVNSSTYHPIWIFQPHDGLQLGLGYSLIGMEFYGDIIV